MSECRGPGCNHPGCHGDRTDQAKPETLDALRRLAEKFYEIGPAQNRAQRRAAARRARRRR